MTAEKLYDKYKAKTGQVVNYDSFIEAITEDRKEIRDKIEEMILQAQIFKWSKYKNVVAGQVEALTELLIFIKEK
jgi:ABC-type phosphate transport system ATPase subunit